MTTGGWVRRSGAVPVLPAVVVLAVAAAGWFVLNRGGPHGPLVLGWVSPPVAIALAALALRRTASGPDLPAGARRFWNQISFTAALSAVGLVVQAAFAVLGPPPTVGSGPPRVPLIAGVCYAVAQGYAVWALLRVPIAARTTSEWVRLWLDVATVVIGTFVVMWYLAFSPLLGNDPTRADWVPVLVGLICVVAVSAIAKIVIAGAGPVDAGALRLLGAGLLMGGISAGVTTAIASQPYLIPAQVSVPVIAVAVVLAGERQARALAAHRPAEPPRRPYRVSFLPYVAVVVTDVLLILATPGSADNRRYVVVAGAIVITALVVVRQMVAFADNAHLVNRLRQQEDRLRHQASHDALTSLANRTLFAGP